MAFPDFEQNAKNFIPSNKRRWVDLGYVTTPRPVVIPSGSTGSIYNVRVEANDFASATMRWSYNGSSSVKVYRSTDNISYSLVETTTSTYPITTYTYTDDGTLAERTLYYYKLTDDNGLTYTAPVHVRTYIEAMPRGKTTSIPLISPNAIDEVTPELFNALVDKLNFTQQASRDQSSDPCVVCSQDGSLVIDCSSGCEWFRTILTEDINSISLVGCDGCPPVDMVIPPNTTRRICGWPIGCDYGSDECFDAPIPGGADGRVARTGGMTYGGYWNAAPPGQNTGSCPCPLASTTLALVTCSGTLSC